MISHIPVWVFALLIFLIAIGALQARTRLVSPARAAIPAIALSALSIYGLVSTFGGSAVSVIGWVMGFIVSGVVLKRLFAPQGMVAVDQRIRVPGSWVPMWLMLGIFATKFALGFGAAMHWPALSESSVVFAVSALLGTFSGGFAARAIGVLQFAKSMPHLRVPGSSAT